MHHGYYLLPIDNPDDWVTPDFLDKNVIRQFDDFVQQRVAEAARDGKRLICECVGVEWSYYSGTRFIVQSAKLEAR
jgi:hypothetical protein